MKRSLVYAIVIVLLSGLNLYAANGDVVVSGNVGIGTTTPSAKLDVNGKFKVDSNGNPTTIREVPTSFPESQGSAGTYLKNDGSGNLTWATASPTSGIPAGAVVQTVKYQTTNYTTWEYGGYAANEYSAVGDYMGGECMTLSITPTNANNLLKIEVMANVGTVDASWLLIALFQDGANNGNAIAVTPYYMPVQPEELNSINIPLTYYMTAGTTSATTFSVNVACDTESAALSLNSQGKFGNKAVSNITISEIQQ